MTRKGGFPFGAVLAGIAVLLPTWALLVNTTSISEAVVGGFASAFACCASGLAASFGRLTFRPRLRWAVRLWRAPWWILADSVIVLVALAKSLLGDRSTGRTRVVRLPPPDDHSRAAARSAFVEGGGSVGPNRYVLGLDESGQVAVVHQLRPAADAMPPQELVADQ
jgi:hypothetical protein